MKIDFALAKCQDNTERKLFGLCDDKKEQRAYLDETDGAKWIAVVVNEYEYSVTFTAIDHCIETKREDGKMDSRCDGFLNFNTTVIFIELKERSGHGNAWVIEGEKQLRTSINYFKRSNEDENFTIKRAYISNKEHPKFKESQSARMDKFFNETGYILRIENRIIL